MAPENCYEQSSLAPTILSHDCERWLHNTRVPPNVGRAGSQKTEILPNC